MKPAKWTEAKIMGLLRTRYTGPAWGLLEHVRNGTGFQGTARTIDAIAMSIWPSRGLHLHAFEIKTSRVDWLREMKQPEKAEDIFQFVDFWWVVAAPEVVNPDELPKTWGLLEARGKQLRVVKEAPELNPKPPERLFLASLFRKLSAGAGGADVIREERRAAHDEGYEDGKAEAKEDIERAREDQEKAEAVVKEFEERTGLQFRTWAPPKEIADAVSLIMRDEHKGLKRQLERVKVEIEGLLRDCTKAIAALEVEGADVKSS